MYHIKMTEEFGRDLYADKTISRGSIVAQFELLVLSPVDTTVVNRTGLEHYTFKFDAERDCLVLGEGEIFNHSATPNCSYNLVDFDGRKVMEFRALRDIGAGEQLFIDYTADVAVNADSYIRAKSLI